MLLAAVLLATALLAGCASIDERRDYWGVRASTAGGRAQLQSISHVGAGKPPRRVPVAPVVLRQGQRGNVSVELRYDRALAGTWAGAGPWSARELDRALHWLEQLAARAGRKARLVVTLVDRGTALDARPSHDATDVVTVDLYLPVDPEATSRSAAIGAALATALHEAAHALPDRRMRTGHYQDEYRASLVESCYLLDTLRPGDVLELRVDPAPVRDNHYAVIQSRRAAAAVMRELQRHVGATTLVAGTAPVPELDALCAATLAGPSAPVSAPAAADAD